MDRVFVACVDSSAYQMRFVILIEKSADGYGSHVPDLPGCVAVAESEAEAGEMIREVIELHLEAMREDGEPIPEPATRAESVEIGHTT
jgi:predicted RNase H-like HicB family nuclease